MTQESGGSLRKLGDGAFQESGLRSFRMPDTVSELGKLVFAYCQSLSEIRLSGAITILEKDLFSECAALESLTVPASVRKIEGFAMPSGLRSVSFETGSQCEEILCNAFAGTRLESIVLPAKLKSVGADTPENAQSGAFAGIQTLKSVTVTGPALYVGARSFYACPALQTLAFSGNGSIETLGESAFNGANLAAANFPDGLRTVGSRAIFRMQGCELTLPATVKTIADNAFRATTLTLMHDDISELTIGAGADAQSVRVRASVLDAFCNRFGALYESISSF